MTFIKAERKQVKAKIALTGPSGSGKTMSALLIAAGIGKRIAVVDTENKSASLYAGMTTGPLTGIEFDVLEIEPPYTIARYLEAIEAAERAKYDVLVIDSISHAWAGEGGLLDKKAALDERPNSNSYTNWAKITPEHERFRARLLQADVHLICTMRSKQDYVLEVNERGKSAPKKVGLAPIQRDGMEYEFMLVLDLGMDHSAIASKDRTSLFDGTVEKPTRKTGERLMAWLNGGKAVQPKTPVADEPPAKTAEETPPMITSDQLAKISLGVKAMLGLGWPSDKVEEQTRAQLKRIHNRDFAEFNELTAGEAETAIDYLKRWADHVRQGKSKAAMRHAQEERAEMEI
jgi:hypothetical protein